MKQVPKKSTMLCALIGAGISCIGVGHAEIRLTEHNARPLADVAHRFEPSMLSVTQPEKRIASPGRKSRIASNRKPPSEASDEIEKLWLAWQESETILPSLPKEKSRRVADAMLLKPEIAPRKLARLPIADTDNAGLRLSESASPDNATDTIHATLDALAERRPDLFALDNGDNGDAPRTTSHVSMPVVQPTVLSSRVTRSAPATDPVQPENITLQSEQADAIKKNRREQSPAREWLAVSNNSLDDMRGGFDNGAGLMVSFGIERAVYINGNLTTSVSFNIPDVGKFAAGQAQIAANQATLAADQARIVAEQAKVTADQARLAADQARITAGQTAVATAQAGAAAGQTAVAIAQAGATAGQTAIAATQTGVAAAQAGLNEQVRVASEQAKIDTEQARLSSEQAKINSEQARLTSEQAKIGSVTGATVNLVQNGPGNTFQPGPLPQTVAATIIQNTLDNQSIKSLTVINTTVNSLGALKALNAQTSLREALGNALGVR